LASFPCGAVRSRLSCDRSNGLTGVQFDAALADKLVKQKTSVVKDHFMSPPDFEDHQTTPFPGSERSLQAANAIDTLGKIPDVPGRRLGMRRRPGALRLRAPWMRRYRGRR
jgi:hypothetical protein